MKSNALPSTKKQKKLPQATYSKWIHLIDLCLLHLVHPKSPSLLHCSNKPTEARQHGHISIYFLLQQLGGVFRGAAAGDEHLGTSLWIPKIGAVGRIKKGMQENFAPTTPAHVYVQKHPCNEVLQVVTLWRDPIFETFEAADISYCCLILPMSFLYENKRTILGFEVDIPASSMGHGSCIFIPSISWTCIRHCHANWCSSHPCSWSTHHLGKKIWSSSSQAQPRIDILSTSPTR